MTATEYWTTNQPQADGPAGRQPFRNGMAYAFLAIRRQSFRDGVAYACLAIRDAAHGRATPAIAAALDALEADYPTQRVRPNELHRLAHTCRTPPKHDATPYQ